MASKLAIQALPPSAYSDPAVLELENKTLFSHYWQWVGLTEELKNPGGISAFIAGKSVQIAGEPGSLRVSLNRGESAEPIADAIADNCGHFVFARLSKNGPSLIDFLGEYAAVLQHCNDGFDEAYHVDSQEWACNWKIGLEITLEGYHVPVVHDADGSKFVEAVPEGRLPEYKGRHSNATGVMSDQMRAEMATIAKRLKISPSTIYENYDHFTLFPNMTIGFSGGCLCFMQIYTPLAVDRTRLSFAYLLAKPLDADKPPVPVIKKTLLDKWRAYTYQVLGEDQEACERFQIGVSHATKPGLLGAKAEERVVHFQKHWRDAVKI
jgi:phenylpropionate dioxygenase-like ring-hydroxylating dioxygenase large terminal subunit